MSWRPPRSYFHHLTSQQLYHLDEMFAAGGGQLEVRRAARRYGLTSRQIIEAVARYRGQRYREQESLVSVTYPDGHLGPDLVAALAPDQS